MTTMIEAAMQRRLWCVALRRRFNAAETALHCMRRCGMNQGGADGHLLLRCALRAEIEWEKKGEEMGGGWAPWRR